LAIIRSCRQFGGQEIISQCRRNLKPAYPPPHGAIMSATIAFARATFLLSAPNLRHCPPDNGAEVAFAGRSNAGKSSAINRLTGNNKLARTSKTPGRTRLINFFSLTDQQRLVDLPGYGYAKVPRAMKEEWDRNLANYLRMRNSLRGLILLMDIRHPLQAFDRQMLNWAGNAGMPVHILLTKADKLSRGEAKSTLLTVRQELLRQHASHPISAQTFSALKSDGLDELGEVLNGWLAMDEPDFPA